MWLPLWLVLPALLSATGWQAWPALEAALGSVQATKEIVIKRLLPLPCTTLLHYPSLPWDAARSRVAAHCPTVNNALGSLVSGGVATSREERLTPGICRKKIFFGKSSEIWKAQMAKESRGCLRVLWSIWPDVDLLLLPVLLKFNVPPIGQEWRNGGQGMEIWSQIIIGEILGSQKIHFENMFSES